MYSVEVQVQCHCYGCQVIIGRCGCSGGSGLNSRCGSGLGGIGLRSLYCTADNHTKQFQDEDKDNQKGDDHAEAYACHHPHMLPVYCKYHNIRLLEWNVTVFLERVGKTLALQHLETADDACACVPGLNYIVNIATVGSLVG